MKYTLSICALLLALSMLFGCSSRSRNTQEPATAETIAETTTQEETTESFEDFESETDYDDSNYDENGSVTITTPNYNSFDVKLIVDYVNTPSADWQYSKEDPSKIEGIVLSLTSVEYGSAGSQAQEDSRTLTFLELSNNAETADTIDVLLSEMTPIQKDFFSFAWDSAINNAVKALNNAESFKVTVATNFGIEFNADDYSAEKINELDKTVQEIFARHEIRKYWTNFEDFEGFISH